MADRDDEYGYRRVDEVVTVRVETEGDPQDPEAIRTDIRETRERMSQTIDELSGRLNPDHLKAQVKENIREATIGRAEHMARNAVGRVQDTRQGMMDTIRDNPIPAAMVGIGLGWLLWNGRRRHDEVDVVFRPEPGWDAAGYDRYGTYDRPGYASYQGYYEGHTEPGLTDRVAGHASDLGGRARETAGDVAGRAREAAGGVAESARDVAGRTREAAGEAAGRAQE
ncbi:MAG TPA: DUF3618 domain-containing protein, partial [Longimicrobiaceae bacterium]